MVSLLSRGRPGARALLRGERSLGGGRVLVLGGSGFVGGRVCASLLALRAQPLALSRSGGGDPSVRHVSGDLLSDDWHRHVRPRALAPARLSPVLA